MHGRKRTSLQTERENESDRNKSEAISAEVSAYRDLLRLLESNHAARVYTPDAVAISRKLLEANPDVYTAWNYRKRATQHLLSEARDDPLARKKIADEELRLVERALHANPKSYGAWHHRRWIVGQGLADIGREFRLISQLLKLDERNFHGWDYRRFVANYAGVSLEGELAYSMEKINEEPRNYSAWHCRSKMLTAKDSTESSHSLLPETLKSELDLVKQAMWTAVDDQSGFIYYQWLISQLSLRSRPTVVASWPIHSSTVKWLVGKPLQAALAFSRPIRLQELSSSILSAVDASTGLEGGHISSLHAVGDNNGESATWTCHLFPFTAVGVAKLRLYADKVGNPAVNFPELEFSVTVEELEDDSGDRWQQEIGEDPFGQMAVLSPDSLPGEAGAMIGWLENQFGCQAGDLEVLEWQKDLLTEEIDVCRQLLEEEAENSKWPTLTLAKLLMADQSLRGPIHQPEVLSLFQKLSVDDPDHEGYYKDEISSLQLNFLTSRGDELAKRWWVSPGLNGRNGWLKLGALGLSRLDGIHNLTWVERLDLSRNNISLLTGIEALQCLRSLNLSYNSIQDWDALRPLRHLPKLVALDVSHNGIKGSSCCVFRSICVAEGSQNGDKELEINTFVDFLSQLKLKVLDVRGNIISELIDWKVVCSSLEIVNGLRCN